MAFLDRHQLDIDHAAVDTIDEQRAELEAIERRIDAEYGYGPSTFSFRSVPRQDNFDACPSKEL